MTPNLSFNQPLIGATVYRNRLSFTSSGFFVIKRYVLCCLLVFSQSPLTYGEQNENAPIYHQVITQVFPELDTAIFEALEPPGTTETNTGLKKVTVKAYRDWHKKFLEIKNSPLPDSARQLTKELSPDGFEQIMKIHRYISPLLESYSEIELVIHCFLQIVGAAINKTESLKSLHEELAELFQCNNKDCEIYAGITETNDGSTTSEDEVKRRLFFECIESRSSLLTDKRNDFCNAFLQQTVF